MATPTWLSIARATLWTGLLAAAHGGPGPLAPPPAHAQPPAFSYAALDTVLQAHVRHDRVDYGALARERGPLDRFIASTREARPERWTRDDQIAFWVNAYNARVLEGVIRRPGLKSVLEVGESSGASDFFNEKALTARRQLSLNEIEHEILRKKYRNARIHFVLNCASISCPLLPSRALTGATLAAALESATREFLGDRERNRIAGHTMELSSIFKWYREDFEAEDVTLQRFIQRHAGAPIDPEAQIRFLDYDWGLNGDW